MDTFIIIFAVLAFLFIVYFHWAKITWFGFTYWYCFSTKKSNSIQEIKEEIENKKDREIPDWAIRINKKTNQWQTSVNFYLFGFIKLYKWQNLTKEESSWDKFKEVFERKGFNFHSLQRSLYL